MFKCKQEDVTPIWTIVIWEDLEESRKFQIVTFTGGYQEAVKEANKRLEFYKV